MAIGITELAIVISIAAALGLVARMLKQPIFLAYLATGLIIGFFQFTKLVEPDFFHIFSDLGIMFLLFLIGLEINYTSIKKVGKIALILGMGQIFFTFGFGFLMAKYLFGFSSLVSSYISLALTFSSTVIIVKLLSEKKDLHSLYGKISLGFLLVQDFVAILVLIILSGIQNGAGVSLETILFTIIKGFGIIFLVMLLGRKFLPAVFDRVARSQELLFLVSLAWLFILVSLVEKIGFSIEIAGFLAGLALANSSENFEISSRMRPLRDFFLLIFFIILGSSVVLNNLTALTVPIIVFSIFILVGNPLIVFILMGIMGYKRRTVFLTGLTVAQISEFSLILAAAGLRVGHLNEDIVGLITGVGLITITISSYLIMNGDKLFKYLKNILIIFERKKTSEDDFNFDESYHKKIILIGAKRTGQSIAFNIKTEDLLVIDFDPDVVNKLREKNYSVLLGDIGDVDVFDSANFDEAKLVISTSPDFTDNMNLIQWLDKLPGDRKLIVRARTERDAKQFYKAGVDYVILPHYTAGHTVGKLIAEDSSGDFLNELKKNDLKMLKVETITE